MKIITFLLGFFILILLFPFQQANADPLLMHAQFSPGGYSVTLWMDEKDPYSSAFMRRMNIWFCDDTYSSIRAWGGIPPLGTRGHLWNFRKPVERIVVFWTGVDQDYAHDATFRRDCADPIPDNNLFCNVIEVTQPLQRGVSGSINFISQNHLRNAWLILENEYNWIPIQYLISSPNTREWTGIIEGADFPFGNYKNVLLVIQDEFDRQAKCRVGEVLILDWGN